VRRWLRIAAAPHLRAADAEWRRLFTPEEKRRLLVPEWQANGPDLEPLWLDEAIAASCEDGIQRRLAGDFRGRLAEAILVTYDKTAMAHSLEARLPFLDRGVIELAEVLPSRLKMHRGREKVAVGELARRLLPPDIAARRKQGLSYPKRSWSRPPAVGRLRPLLLDGDDRGPFQAGPLARLLAHEAGRREEERRFATLVFLRAWWNEHFSQSTTAPVPNAAIEERRYPGRS
jgi:asparagine synthase (glutamine-hydrolysing)